MNVTYDYSGYIVLVTGAASGIGLAAAQAFGRSGAHVILADLSDDHGHHGAEAIVAQGGSAEFVHLDVASQREVDNVVAGIVARHGKLDIAFNNAGIGGAFGPLTAPKSDEWKRIIDVDLMSVYYCMHAEIRAMERTGGGAIVNNASVAGIAGLYDSSAYVAAKHGVVGMTRATAMDYARRGIRINSVCPGLIDTPALDLLPRPALERLRTAAPIERAGTTDEVAQAVMWLASDAASYVIGHALPVDGGVAMGGNARHLED